MKGYAKTLEHRVLCKTQTLAQLDKKFSNLYYKSSLLELVSELLHVANRVEFRTHNITDYNKMMDFKQQLHCSCLSGPRAISSFRHLMSFSVLWTKCNDSYCLISFMGHIHCKSTHLNYETISVKIWYPQCRACRSDLIYTRFFIWNNSYYPSLHWNRMRLNS